MGEFDGENCWVKTWTDLKKKNITSNILTILIPTNKARVPPTVATFGWSQFVLDY